MKISELKTWEEGIGQVLQGDCLDLMRMMPDKCVDLILTDPPYGTTAIEWDEVVDFTGMWNGLKRIIKDGGPIVMTASQPFTTDLINSNRGWFKYCWVWSKKHGGNAMLANIQPLKLHEDICVFGKGKTNYFPQMRSGKLRLKGGATNSEHGWQVDQKINDQYFPSSIIEVSNAKKEGLHPTQKPTGLFGYLIATYSKVGETIFDPFMGSWTTAVAAKQLGRRWIGAELSEEYCAIGVERLRQGILL